MTFVSAVSPPTYGVSSWSVFIITKYDIQIYNNEHILLVWSNIYINLLLSIGKFCKYHFEYDPYKKLIYTTFIHKMFHEVTTINYYNIKI